MLKASKHEANLKIRSPFRVVEDDDVDRRQVHGRQRPQPSRTNHPKAFLARIARAAEAVMRGERGRYRQNGLARWIRPRAVKSREYGFRAERSPDGFFIENTAAAHARCAVRAEKAIRWL